MNDKSVSALRALVRACNYRDAVIATSHDDKRDLAVENYARALVRAQDLLEGRTAEVAVASLSDEQRGTP
jgi:hypothetical protein